MLDFKEILHFIYFFRRKHAETLFQPGRVVLQDFTGIAALVDLASMRDLVASKDIEPSKVDSKCPADLVVDHSVQVDFSYIEKLVAKQTKDIEAEEAAIAAAASISPNPPTYMIPQSTFPPFCPYNPQQVPPHHGGEVFYHQPYYQPPIQPMMDVQGAHALPPQQPPNLNLSSGKYSVKDRNNL